MQDGKGDVGGYQDAGSASIMQDTIADFSANGIE